MKDKFKIIFLSYLCAASCALRADVFDDVFSGFDSAMRDMKRQIKQTREYAQKALQRADQSIKNFGGQISLGANVKFEDQGEYLKTVIDFNGSNIKQGDSYNINMKGKDNSLKGSVSCGDYKIDIMITDGQFINVTHKYSSKKESSKNTGTYQQVSSSSTQSLVLPSKVNKLDKTKAKLSDNKLVLLLPKKEVVATRDGWSKITVESK